MEGREGRVIAGIELPPVSQPIASFVNEMLVVWGWMQTDLGESWRRQCHVTRDALGSQCSFLIFFELSYLRLLQIIACGAWVWEPTMVL